MELKVQIVTDFVNILFPTRHTLQLPVFSLFSGQVQSVFEFMVSSFFGSVRKHLNQVLLAV